MLGARSASSCPDARTAAPRTLPAGPGGTVRNVRVPARSHFSCDDVGSLREQGPEGQERPHIPRCRPPPEPGSLGLRSPLGEAALSKVIFLARC